MISKNLVSLVLGLLLAIMPQLGYTAKQIDKVVAVVNDDIITNSELELHKKLLLARLDLTRIKLPSHDVLRKQILHQMVLDKLQLQLAIQSNLEIDSTTLKQTLDNIASSEGMSLATFEKRLQAKGISPQVFKQHLQQELTIEELRQREVRREVVISNTDIDGFLNSPVGQDRSGTEYQLRHILLSGSDAPNSQQLADLKQQAQQIVNELRNGQDFAKMAIAKSAGQQALHGGDLGWRKLSALPTIFVKQVPLMQINEIAGPIQSSNGFHIIKLEGKRIGKVQQHLETHVRQILIKPSVDISDAEAEANLLAIKAQILKGQDFAKVAERKSEELDTASNGGDLGWITPEAVLPEFYQVMLTLKNGEISEPFKTDIGWHLIQVLDRRSQATSIEAARNRAKEILRERKFQEMLEAWLKRLRDNAKVEILI